MILILTARGLNQSCVLSGDIGTGYMFLGIVVLSSDPSKVDVSWSQVELSHECSDIVRPGVGRCGDDPYVVICVDRQLVCIVAKNDNGNVDNINHF